MEERVVRIVMIHCRSGGLEPSRACEQQVETHRVVRSVALGKLADVLPTGLLQWLRRRVRVATQSLRSSPARDWKNGASGIVMGR